MANQDELWPYILVVLRSSTPPSANNLSQPWILITAKWLIKASFLLLGKCQGLKRRHADALLGKSIKLDHAEKWQSGYLSLFFHFLLPKKTQRKPGCLHHIEKVAPVQGRSGFSVQILSLHTLRNCRETKDTQTLGTSPRKSAFSCLSCQLNRGRPLKRIINNPWVVSLCYCNLITWPAGPLGKGRTSCW